MASSWLDIAGLELAEDYLGAVVQLERLLAADPSDAEAVIRLGFNYWLAMTEADRLTFQSPTVTYASRFRSLLADHYTALGHNADFCWSYGLPLTLHHYYFARDGTDAAELDRLSKQGKRLVDRAAGLAPLYARLLEGKASPEDLAARFRGRGSLARYYGVV